MKLRATATAPAGAAPSTSSKPISPDAEAAVKHLAFQTFSGFLLAVTLGRLPLGYRNKRIGRSEAGEEDLHPTVDLLAQARDLALGNPAHAERVLARARSVT